MRIIPPAAATSSVKMPLSRFPSRLAAAQRTKTVSTMPQTIIVRRLEPSESENPQKKESALTVRAVASKNSMFICKNYPPPRGRERLLFLWEQK